MPRKGCAIDQNTICFIVVLCRPGGLRRSDQTRSHPELGRQTLQRQWYYVSRPGRVGRRQACKTQQCLFFDRILNSSFIGGLPADFVAGLAGYKRVADAGWSSPVARQAHNLKVVSSNLAPATKSILSEKRSPFEDPLLLPRDPDRASAEPPASLGLSFLALKRRQCFLRLG
jgi:hypothetical protein